MITLFARPVPVAGAPAEKANELLFIVVMLYEATVGVFKSVAKVSATAASEHTVLV